MVMVMVRARWMVIAVVLSGLVQVPDQAPEASLAPSDQWSKVGTASWYSEQDPGIQPLTASGEPFDDTQLTAAMWNVPMGSCLQIVNLKTLERITVRVNDRGPHPRLASAGRVIDLSRAAFAQFADLGDGLVPVSIELAARTRCVSTYASR